MLARHADAREAQPVSEKGTHKCVCKTSYLHMQDKLPTHTKQHACSAYAWGKHVKLCVAHAPWVRGPHTGLSTRVTNPSRGNFTRRGEACRDPFPHRFKHVAGWWFSAWTLFFFDMWFLWDNFYKDSATTLPQNPAYRKKGIYLLNCFNIIFNVFNFISYP